jgi:DNA-binding transcriptional LysR family regulator
VDWDDLRFFLIVARCGTLSAAARELRVTQPTVGRRITTLEQRLGAKLFIRRSDGFVPSSWGMRVLEHAERMEQSALAVERRVSGRDEGLRGTVRITASEWLVTSVLSPLLGPLLARHSQLTIEILADQRHVNLARREADLAIRPRRFEQEGIVQRAVAKLGFGLYAAGAYVSERGLPTAGGGRDHVLVAMTNDAGDVVRSWLEATLPLARVAARTNGRDAMNALATAGVGLTCLARIVGDRTPSLQRVPITPPPPTPTLWMGTHRDAHSTPRVRAVASFVADRLKELQSVLCPPE